MDPNIVNVLQNFKKPLKRVVNIHYKNYRYLLPSEVNKFIEHKKFRCYDTSYDLYGWIKNAIVDIYPTYKNINTKENLPSSWIKYIKEILRITNVDNFILLIYNKRYNKYTNVIYFNNIAKSNINKSHQVTSEWIKATGLKNYIMDDTILDIINKNKTEESNINIENDSEENELLLDRLTMGNEFERDIVDILINKYFIDFVKICESYEAKDTNKYNTTLDEMNKGTPLIHQAVLHDPVSKIYGCVDLLVRSDWLNKIFVNYIPDEETLNGKIHYVVVDIKFHRIQYNADGQTIRNEGMMKVFKSQLYIYNKALGSMQDYIPNKAYILGRGWIKTNIENGNILTEKNNNPFDKPGIIDFKNVDRDIVKKSEDGLKWLSELKNNNFDETKPKYNHCYPNMNNPTQLGGKKRKLSIAEDSNELTLLGYVGVKQRKIALEHGINSYKDPNLNGEKLGLSGKTEKIINTLIENQKEMDQPIKGKYVCPSVKNVEVFLDFEYLYSFNSDENIPYLCGIGYVNNIMEDADVDTNDTNDTSTWKFEYILLDDVTVESRNKMCKEITEILEKIKATHIYTWSDVDRRLLTNECKKFNLDDKIFDIKWIDMYKFCLTNHINFKGAKGYGLKEIGRVLYETKLTDLKWTRNLSSSSTVGATKHYYKNMKWNPKNIIDYNHIDCKMIYEILKNLRLYENKS
jgi:hypothetical protein